MTVLSALLYQAPRLVLVEAQVLQGPHGAQLPGGPAVADPRPSFLWRAIVVPLEALVGHRRDPWGLEGGKQASPPEALQGRYVLLLYHKGSEALIEVAVALRVSVSHQSSDGFALHSLASCCLKGLHSSLISPLPIDCRLALYRTQLTPHSHECLLNIRLG